MVSCPLVSSGHEIVAPMWQFPQLEPFLAHQSWSHEYVNNGESFYQRRRSKLLVVFTQIYPPPPPLLLIWFNLTLASKWISESIQIISHPFLRHERILQRPGSCLWRRPLWQQVSTLVRRCPSLRTPLVLVPLTGDPSPPNNNNGVPLCALWQSLPPCQSCAVFSRYHLKLGKIIKFTLAKKSFINGGHMGWEHVIKSFLSQMQPWETLNENTNHQSCENL